MAVHPNTRCTGYPPAPLQFIESLIPGWMDVGVVGDGDATFVGLRLKSNDHDALGKRNARAGFKTLPQQLSVGKAFA
jgi:hypothetical protein